MAVDTSKTKSTGYPAPEENKPARTKRAPAVPKSNNELTDEAKGLKELAKALSAKNAPETSKDITAFAKDTLKLVAKSQKSESAAFRREATKALIEFRNFVEKTDKINDLRRNKLLSDIDSVNLDTKNATMMLLSVARTQAKNIKESAKHEASVEKLKLHEYQKTLIAESEAKAKQIKIDAELRSKAMMDEHSEKIKNVTNERKLRHQMMMEQGRADIQKRKDALDQQRKDHSAKMDQHKTDIKSRKDKLKQDKDAHSLKVDQDKQALKTQKDQYKQNYANLKLQLQQQHDARTAALKQQKDAHSQQVQQDRLKLQQDRNDAAVKIKKLKSDLRDDHSTKMRAAHADIAQKKSDNMTRNKTRIQKIRQMTVEHKLRLRKIEQEYRDEGILRKAALKRQLREDEKKLNKSAAHGEKFKGTLKEGALEANPLIHATYDLYKGVKGMMDSKKKEKKLQSVKAQHKSNAPGGLSGKGSAPAPANGPNNGPAAQGGGGGFLGGILSLLPDVAGIVGGIAGLFSGIVGAFSGVGSMLLGVARFIPVIGTVAAIVGGVWKFIEGFNDAASVFGDKVSDTDYTKRVYAGFVNVVNSILGIFDTVAGWLGFNTDLEGSFKKNAVKLFDMILGAFKSLAGGLGNLLDYIPGMGSVAKGLKDYANSDSSGSIQPSSGPGNGAALSDKTNTVNDLQDDLDTRKQQKATVQVVADNSVKQNSTTLVNQKMTTRNDDSTAALYGYGMSI